MLILETPRIILRHLEPGDLDALFALYRDLDASQIEAEEMAIFPGMEELSALLQKFAARPWRFRLYS